jgi:hypothetical protein
VRESIVQEVDPIPRVGNRKSKEILTKQGKEKTMMNTKISCLVAASVVAIFAATPALAQDTLTAYVVHGIPGDDFDPNLNLDPALPVDVYVSGLECAIPGFEFGDRVGPLEIAAGNYDITISLADEENPCEGEAVISLTGVVLPPGVNATVIAHRTADGSPVTGDVSGLGITATIFPNDFTPTDRGKARIVAHHTAKAPSVDVVVSRDYYDPTAPSVTVPGFTNPTGEGDPPLSQIIAQFRPGEWDVALEAGGDTVFGPDTIRLRPYTATYIYAVGDFFGSTFQYLVFTEGGLKPRNGRDRIIYGLRRFGKR